MEYIIYFFLFHPKNLTLKHAWKIYTMNLNLENKIEFNHHRADYFEELQPDLEKQWSTDVTAALSRREHWQNLHKMIKITKKINNEMLLMLVNTVYIYYVVLF